MADRSFIDAYEVQPQTLRDAVAGLSPAQLRSFPIPGTWSIQQVVIHLADTELVIAERIKRILAEETPQIQPFDQSLWAANLAYDAQSTDDAIAMIDLVRRQMTRVLRTLPDAAFERQGVHGEVGAISIKWLVDRANAHLSHHLKFVVEKRKKLDPPA